MSTVELKVKSAAWAALLVTLAGETILGTTVTDFVPSLPDWLEVPAYSLITSGVVFLAAFRRKNVAGKLAPSTIEAAEAEFRKQ
jgi:hypothetical protein